MTEGSDDRDPMRADSWYAEPNVCGSCIAWRPEDPREGETVAAGSCRLRGDLGRVPATLGKCSMYKPRGKFVYQPSRERSAPTRRKRATTVRVMKRDASGELVADVSAPVRRSAPRARPPVPREVELGTDDRTGLRSVLREIYAEDYTLGGRDMHGRFEAGKTAIVSADGQRYEVDNARFFEMLERFRSRLEALEDALVSKDALLDQFADLNKATKQIQGTFTTFNFLYADRSDYFSGK